MKAQDFNGRGIVCVFYDWEERCWLRGESYYRKEETQFMYADDWEKYEAQRLLLEESMSFVTLDGDTAKLLLEHENNHKKAQVKQYNEACDLVINCDITGLPMPRSDMEDELYQAPRSPEERRELARDIDKAFESLRESAMGKSQILTDWAEKNIAAGVDVVYFDCTTEGDDDE